MTWARPALAVAAWCLLVLGRGAHAADAAPTVSAEPTVSPWAGNLSVWGNLSRGNLDQVQIQGRGELTYRSPTVENDLFLRAFRVYLRPEGAPAFARIGDDLTVQETALRFLTPATQAGVLGRYETSQLHRLDHRLLFGLGFGVLPVQGAQGRLRVLAAGMLEHDRYPDDTFRIDVRHNGPLRTVPRVALLSDGHWRVDDTPLSLRGSALVVVDPTDLRDRRIVLDAAVDLTAWGPLSMQVAATYTYTSVVLVGVDPQDLQVALGLSIRAPRLASDQTSKQG